MPVKLLADSGSDLPLQFLKENNMKLFPLKVLLKEQEYEDLITIEPKTIYTAIRNGEVPKTSQVSPTHLKRLLQKWLKIMKKGFILAFSSQLSGTYQTAVMMRDQVKQTISRF